MIGLFVMVSILIVAVVIMSEYERMRYSEWHNPPLEPLTAWGVLWRIVAGVFLGVAFMGFLYLEIALQAHEGTLWGIPSAIMGALK